MFLTTTANARKQMLLKITRFNITLLGIVVFAALNALAMDVAEENLFALNPGAAKFYPAGSTCHEPVAFESTAFQPASFGPEWIYVNWAYPTYAYSPDMNPREKSNAF